MTDLKPWRLRDPAAGAYLARKRVVPSVGDRMFSAVAAPVVARFPPGLRKLARAVRLVDQVGNELPGLSDAALRDAADALRPKLAAQGLTADLVARAFALVREAASRHLGLRHYPVQIMGGWAMLHGMLAEMATGEGKTITAALPAATAALTGMPVHVITVNDYLAERDAGELGPLYRALGLTVGCVVQQDQETARRAAYGADVTYVTGKEVAFDFLRDRLAMQARRAPAGLAMERLFGQQPPSLRLSGLGFAVVDEADSVLIDEARTPLIIATRNEDAVDPIDYAAALQVAASLRADADFMLRPDLRSAVLTDTGKASVAAWAEERAGLWRYRRAREEIAEQALAAIHLYARDREYIVRDNEVQIVDEYTGRVAEGRHWERGLHQLIETKEQAKATPRDATAARITTQSFFRRYARLSGMTGTAREHAAEFWSVYGLRVARVPTHRPVLRRRVAVRLLPDGASRWQVVADSAAQQSAAGRPVLIGTRSVAASEAISRRLTSRDLRHNLLNARQDGDEAAMVAQAGQSGRITVATNMAGRGTDIRLAPGIAERGGLHVIVTEFHESPRIDRQLIGRGARQGDPGTWEAITSIDDPLFALHVARLTFFLRWARLYRFSFSLWLLRWVSQRAAERKHASDRASVLAVERQDSRQLAFSGRVF
jgi:preprotein translocase subunit SecA